MAKRLKGVPNLPFAPIAALLFGIVAAVLVFATPAWLLERTVASIGISSLLNAAKPPLGDTARSMIAIATGLSVALLLWIVMRPIEKLIHRRRIARPFATGAEAVRVDNADNDWPARATRPPIFAGEELGAPLMSDEALASGGELFLDQSMVEAPALASEPLTLSWPEPAEAELADTVPVEATAKAPEPEPVEAQQEHGWIEFVTETQAEEAEGHPDSLAVSPFAPAEDVREPLTLEWPIPVAAEPHATEEHLQGAQGGGEPSLQQLLHRFEAALDRRNSVAAQGRQPAHPPAASAVASLRNLIEASNKNAA